MIYLYEHGNDWYYQRHVVAVIAGHRPLNKHSFNISMIADSVCRGCIEAEKYKLTF